MKDAGDVHRALLEEQGLSGRPAARLAAYLDTLAEWSVRVNLTAARTPEERVSLLVASVLPVLNLPAAGSLLDVGSGNGSPGLVLALLRDDLDVTLLEPRVRRWAFLREAVRRAGRKDVRVLRGRHDTYRGPSASTVTVRALALPLAELAPLVAQGGRLVILGGRPRLEGPFAKERDRTASPGDTHVFLRLTANVPRGTSPAE